MNTTLEETETSGAPDEKPEPQPDIKRRWAHVEIGIDPWLPHNSYVQVEGRFLPVTSLSFRQGAGEKEGVFTLEIPGICVDRFNSLGTNPKDERR